jgi:hypothetical protein
LRSIVADHVVQGRVLLPGAAYIEAARAVSESGLCGVYFLQPLAVETPGLSIECVVSGGRFEVRSDDGSGAGSDAAVHCSGAVGGGCETLRLVNHARTRGQLCERLAHVGSLYTGFDAAGLRYGPGYRTLVQAWVGGADALARLRARWTLEGTAVHPADLDDALCLSALIAATGGDRPRLPFALDSALLQGASAMTLQAV